MCSNLEGSSEREEESQYLSNRISGQGPRRGVREEKYQVELNFVGKGEKPRKEGD